ncbi:acyl-CoA thioesterase [Hydrocarboniphaga sp.]|uniref:acyl-CoA thioesterase n=1 Tax=Hydrocarboniphaga sp. TaxID=2033016 RepID=UPI003D0B88A0
MTDSPAVPMSPPLWDGRSLLSLLPLQALGGDRFASCASDDNFNKRLYGGQLLGQALMAAAYCAPVERRAHVLQAIFLRGALPDQPLSFQVQRLLDGGRYSSRQVRVSQGEQAVLDAQVSFQITQDSPLHRQVDADAAPDPEALADMVDLLRESRRFDLSTVPLIEKPCVEMRPVAPEQFLFVANRQPRQRFWLKLREPLGTDASAAMHGAAIAYLSDYFVTFCSYGVYTPMVGMRDYYVASLNHGLWFHEPARGDDWLLFDCESPATGHGRGFATVKIFDRQRRLVASATQQCTLGDRR